MSTDLTVFMPDMSGAAIEARVHYAERLAASGLLPDHYKRQPANVLVAIEIGMALGVPPIHALNSIAVINGKPTMSADLMSAVVRRAGHKLHVTERDGAVTAELVRRDDPEFTYRAVWDADKARTAGLWGRKGPWSQFPGQMLRARATTEVCRQGASDALMGVVYTPEEMGAVVDEEGAVVSVPASPPPSVEEVQACEDLKTLRNWWQAFHTDGNKAMEEEVAARADALKAARDSEPAVEPEVVEEPAGPSQESLPVLDGEIVEESES